MTYTLLPNSGESLGQTRAAIRTNFSVLQTAQDVNHVAINASGAGKHKFLQMPEQGSAPTTAADEAGFYAKVGASPAQTNLFFRGESSGFEYQLTRAVSASTATFGLNPAGGGWTFLPGGLIMQWRTISSPTSGTTYSFPVAFTSSCYNLQLTGVVTDNSTVRIYASAAATTTGFTLQSTSSGNFTSLYVLAIGL